MKQWLHTMIKRFERKSSATAPLLIAEAGHRPIWTPRQYDCLAEEGYQKNVIVYRCVSLIARGLASVPWEVMQNGQRLEAHPLLNLLESPNPLQGLSSFMEALTTTILLSGNAYIEGVIHEGKLLELYLLRPDRIRIIPGTSGVPEAFEYTLQGKSVRLSVDPLNGHSSVLHLKTFNPLHDWYGMSPLEAAAHAIDQHNAVASHNLALLQNGGRPTGALQFREGHEGENLTEEQRTRLRDDLRTMIEGADNSGRILIMEGNFEWKEMGLSPKDLDFIEGKYLSAREIAQVYGVPPMLVGVPGDATFSNYKEARYHLWEDTILPLLEMIKGNLNRWISPFYEETVKLEYNTDEIPALASRRETLWEKIDQASFLTLNEKRALLGYCPIPNGDRVQ